MLVLPVGDENPNLRKPYINYLIITLNVLIYLIFGFTSYYQNIVQHFSFVPSKAVPLTYFTSIFLHASILHLLGNMLFLWIVGDNVEDKLGHFWYLLFYLFCGMVSNFIHGILIPPEMMGMPTLGASGAISGVLGAYLVLFPHNKIVFFYFLWIIIFIRWGTFKLASFWAIGMWFILQLFSQASTSGSSPVAYGAHIGGFITGVIIVGILSITGIIKAHWEKEQDYYDINGQDLGRQYFDDAFYRRQHPGFDGHNPDSHNSPFNEHDRRNNKDDFWKY